MIHMERIDVFCSFGDLLQLIKSHPRFIQTLLFPLAWLMTEIITVYTIDQDETRGLTFKNMKFFLLPIITT